MIEGVGGLEAHALFALAMDMPAEKLDASITSRQRSSLP
jgi:hypothetical protein